MLLQHIAPAATPACHAHVEKNIASVVVFPTQAPTLSHLLGLTTTGLAQALAYPLLLTSVLFACPLASHFYDEGLDALLGLGVWLQSIWSAAKSADVAGLRSRLAAPWADCHLWLWRNLVVAPLTEEFVFRACMAPLLMLKVRWLEGSQRYSQPLATCRTDFSST